MTREKSDEKKGDQSAQAEEVMPVLKLTTFSEPPKVILDISGEGVFGGVEPTEESPKQESIIIYKKKKEPLVGLVTGTFDILHQGHIGMIRRAQQECDVLLVAIETDSRVREAKGRHRPIFSQDKRQVRLERALNDGTRVQILPEDFGEEEVRREWLLEHNVKLLFTNKKDMHLENKQFLMMEVGGRVEFLPLLMSVSTTQLLEGRRVPKFLVFESDERIIEEYRAKYGEN